MISMEETRVAKAFGMKNPRFVKITKDVKTKLGLAFKKGDFLVQVWESGIIESGPYTGKQSYSAYSIRTRCMTAIRPSCFEFTQGGN